MRILVCGGRDYSNQSRVHRVLDAAVERLGLSFLIQGGAPGADALAKQWAERRSIPSKEYEAKWGDIERHGAVIRRRRDGTLYDAAAGGVRNQRMLDEGAPEAVIAFPGGNGTADMVRRSKAAGVRVLEIT